MAEDHLVDQEQLDRVMSFIGAEQYLKEEPYYGSPSTLYHLENGWNLTEAVARLSKVSESKLHSISASSTGSLPALNFPSSEDQNVLVISQITKVAKPAYSRVSNWVNARIPAISGYLAQRGPVLEQRIIPPRVIGSYTMPITFNGLSSDAKSTQEFELKHNFRQIHSEDTSFLSSNVFIMGTTRLSRGLQRFYWETSSSAPIRIESGSIHVLGLQPFTFQPEPI